MLENVIMTGYFLGFIGLGLCALTFAIYRLYKGYSKFSEEVLEEVRRDPYTGPTDF